MPGCFRALEEDKPQDEDRTWREPPGYLGEAVRRAKAIARKDRPPPTD
jgi:hypothetical protein